MSHFVFSISRKNKKWSLDNRISISNIYLEIKTDLYEQNFNCSFLLQPKQSNKINYLFFYITLFN